MRPCLVRERLVLGVRLISLSVCIQEHRAAKVIPPDDCHASNRDGTLDYVSFSVLMYVKQMSCARTIVKLSRICMVFSTVSVNL
jgi:hypothetical protein